ncbi:hypothetical protein B0H14DRAFT_2631592 [Mycena olivaceomarginata]|nr:hypothetical protein B0H14DRAFT_2631592 [Mycena olivaceomarginata]
MRQPLLEIGTTMRSVFIRIICCAGSAHRNLGVGSISFETFSGDSPEIENLVPRRLRVSQVRALQLLCHRGLIKLAPTYLYLPQHVQVPSITANTWTEEMQTPNTQEGFQDQQEGRRTVLLNQDKENKLVGGLYISAGNATLPFEYLCPLYYYFGIIVGLGALCGEDFLFKVIIIGLIIAEMEKDNSGSGFFYPKLLFNGGE